MKKFLVLPLLFMATLFISCGGSDSDETTAEEQITPEQITAALDEYAAYVEKMAAKLEEMKAGNLDAYDALYSYADECWTLENNILDKAKNNGILTAEQKMAFVELEATKKQIKDAAYNLKHPKKDKTGSDDSSSYSTSSSASGDIDEVWSEYNDAVDVLMNAGGAIGTINSAIDAASTAYDILDMF